MNELFEKIKKIVFPIYAIIGIVTIIDVPAYFKISLYTEQYLGIYMTMILSGTYLCNPWKKGADFNIVDLILAILCIPTGLYLTINYPWIALNMGVMTVWRTIWGIIAILLILEGLRRSMGWSLVIVCTVFLLYAKFGSNLPGILHCREFTLEKLVSYIYVDPNSLLYMLSFGCTIGVAFIVFGQVLLNYGGGKAFINFALLFCGRSQGGSAKTAVVSSSLVGTITGAPMSNVLLTGSVTIPMMKEAGYPPATAGAVEAVASSGGQIMPPVMGVAAFIIAETLGVPYSEVALAALIPALLYYFATFVQVHMDAGKLQLKLVPKDQLPTPKYAWVNGWFIIPPIAVLLILMFNVGLPAALSAIIASGVALPFVLAKKENRETYFQQLKTTLYETGEMMVGIGIVMAMAGIVVGCINATGLAFNLSLALTSLGANHVFLLLVCAAVTSLILGMGMPSVAAYSLVAILVAPSLIQFGIPAMAAHLFVFYFSVISNITPPVAVSCFAAAPLAGANPTKVGFTAFRLAIAAYIVPFAFCFTPELIMEGEPLDILICFVFCLYAIFSICVALSGFWQLTVPMVKRVLLCAFSVVILWPTSILINLAGAVVLTVLLLPNIKASIEYNMNRKKSVKAAE
ncbi:MAG: TRAP transporter permease [Candidatus Avilachnospira sp.]